MDKYEKAQLKYQNSLYDNLKNNIKNFLQINEAKTEINDEEIAKFFLFIGCYENAKMTTKYENPFEIKDIFGNKDK